MAHRPTPNHGPSPNPLPNPSAGRAYLSKQELADLTGLSPATIQRYKDGRRIPFHQPGGKGGRLLFPAGAIEAAAALAHHDKPARTGGADQADSGSQAGPPPDRRGLPGPRPRWRNRR